jgi:hypothetical protein
VINYYNIESTLNVHQNLRKMPTPFTVSTYDRVADSIIHFSCLKHCQNRREESTEDKKSGCPTTMYRSTNSVHIIFKEFT